MAWKEKLAVNHQYYKLLTSVEITHLQTTHYSSV